MKGCIISVEGKGGGFGIQLRFTGILLLAFSHHEMYAVNGTSWLFFPSQLGMKDFKVMVDYFCDFHTPVILFPMELI